MQMAAEYFKIYHDRFLSFASQFIVIITRSYITYAVDNASLSKRKDKQNVFEKSHHYTQNALGLSLFITSTER